MATNFSFQSRILQNFVNRYIKILGGRFYSPSLKDVAWPERAQLIFLIFDTFSLSVNLAGRSGGAGKNYRQMYEKIEKLTERLLSHLHSSNLVNTIFYLIF